MEYITKYPEIITFIATPLLLSLYSQLKSSTISIPDEEYDFIIIGGYFLFIFSF